MAGFDLALEKFINVIFGSFLNYFKCTYSLINDRKSFFERMKNNELLFVQASLMCLISSALISLIGIPAFKIAGIGVDSIFLVLHGVIAWLVFFILGFQIAFVCKIFKSEKNITLIISAFMYTLPILVVLSVLETKTKAIRMAELASCKLTDDFIENIRAEINSSKFAVIGEWTVLVGYFFYFLFIFSLIKHVNKFGNVKTTIVVLLFCVCLVLTVKYLQTPLLNTLLCAYHP